MLLVLKLYVPEEHPFSFWPCFGLYLMLFMLNVTMDLLLKFYYIVVSLNSSYLDIFLFIYVIICKILNKNIFHFV